MSNTTAKIPEEGWISVPVGKVVTAVVMFLSVLVVMLMPICVISRMNLNRKDASFKNKFKLWLGRLSCFAAGVFLCTGFLDIFPDVIRAINEACIKLGIKIKFPLAPFFTLLGFFMILSIEQMIFLFNERAKSSDHKLENREEIIEKVTHNESSETLICDEEDILEPSLERPRMNQMAASRSDSSSLKDHDHFSRGEEDKGEQHDGDHNSLLHHNKSRIIALMSAISVHAIFEGFAVGLGTTIAGVTQLFLALSLHKFIIAGSLGLNLATSTFSLWFKVLVALIFSMGSPLGILAGIGVMHLETIGNKAFYMVGGALEGIACGTFLYVVFFEILPHEMGHQSKEDRCGKLAGVLLGFLVVCLYIVFVSTK